MYKQGGHYGLRFTTIKFNPTLSSSFGCAKPEMLKIQSDSVNNSSKRKVSSNSYGKRDTDIQVPVTKNVRERLMTLYILLLWYLFIQKPVSQQENNYLSLVFYEYS